MPADSTYEIGYLANADAYTDVKLAGTGHIRVTVAPNCVTVDYIKAFLPADTGATNHNGQIAYSYTVGACTTTAATDKLTEDRTISLFPNPAENDLSLVSKWATDKERKFELINLQGQSVISQTLLSGSTQTRFDLRNIPRGVYALRWLDENNSNKVKMVVLK
jgi:hypothetical protein